MKRPGCVLPLMLLGLAGGCASAPKAPPAPTPPTSAQVGQTTIMAITAPPAHSGCTLPEFLGINAAAKLIGGGIERLRNRLGMRFPGLEAQPAVRAITDPANSDPNAPPSVQAAASVKADQEGAAQKVKAIRYLATVGCSKCYPEVEPGLLAALDDCVEEVRYEAAKALRTTAGRPCKACRTGICCSPKIMEKLNKLAYETDSHGCFKEHSARVRRVARLAMNGCGTGVTATSRPTEGPAEEQSAEPQPAGEPPSQPGEAVQPAGTADAPANAQTPWTVASAVEALTWSWPMTSDRVPSEANEATVPRQPVVAARVNGEPIYLDAVFARVESRLASQPQPGSPAELERLRDVMLRAELQLVVGNRLLAQEARRERYPTHIAQAAYESPAAGELDETQSADVWALADDEALAGEWAQRVAPIAMECSRAELFAFFREHMDRYREPRQVRWEKLTARQEGFVDATQAQETLEFLRRRLLGDTLPPPPGCNPSAVEIATFDWTPQDQLPGGSLRAALATLPVGSISPILHADGALHVVRVIERRAPRAPHLDEVAGVVRDDVLTQRRAAALQAYLHDLRQRSQVWTIFDPPVAPRSTPPASP